MTLEPFQIVYITNDSLAASNDGSMTDMTLLSVTRNHLINTGFSKNNTFQSLELYETVRSGIKDMFTNGTFIAFGGSAEYAEGVSIPDVEKVLYLCFLGNNETVYVDQLRLMGWKNLERALLMTMSGNTVDYVNGSMVMNTEAASTQQQQQMDDYMSRMIYLISVFVPLAVVVLAGGCLVGYLARNNVKWNKNLDANDISWQQSPSKARKLRRLTFEIRDSADDNASEMTPDMASVQVAIATLPRREAKLQKSRTKSKNLAPSEHDFAEQL